LSSERSNSIAYRLAGLRIVSDLPLPGLPLCEGEIQIGEEVVIRRGVVPDSLSTVAAVFPDGQCNNDELLLNIPRVARYLLRGGKEILVEPSIAAEDSELNAYLLGTMFGVLCHQRRIPPLHASAIDIADGCVAFIGESGAGKSTLVAGLAARGHEIISDDVCFLQLGKAGDVQAWPGISRLRLWEDAMTVLGCNGPGVEREYRGYNKYLIPVRPPRLPLQPRRLRRVYQLHASQDGGPAAINRLSGIAALESLMTNVYRLELAERMGFKPAAFVICAAVAREVPVFRFSRRLGFDALHDGIESLEDHLLNICE
jgi:hypothetical protein